jgi:hypothetical protein
MLGLALGYESQLVKYPDFGYWIIGRDTKLPTFKTLVSMWILKKKSNFRPCQKCNPGASNM